MPVDGGWFSALNTTSLKICLPSINWRYWQAVKIHACVWKFKVTWCKRTSLKSIKFSQKKVGYFSKRVSVLSQNEQYTSTCTSTLFVEKKITLNNKLYHIYGHIKMQSPHSTLYTIFDEWYIMQFLGSRPIKVDLTCSIKFLSLALPPESRVNEIKLKG